MDTSIPPKRFNRFVFPFLCFHVVTAYDKWYSTQSAIKPPTSPASTSALPFPSFSPTKRKSHVTEEECERMRAQLLQQIDSEEIHSRKSVDSNHAAEIAELLISSILSRRRKRFRTISAFPNLLRFPLSSDSV